MTADIPAPVTDVGETSPMQKGKTEFKDARIIFYTDDAVDVPRMKALPKAHEIC